MKNVFHAGVVYTFKEIEKIASENGLTITECIEGERHPHITLDAHDGEGDPLYQFHYRKDYHMKYNEDALVMTWNELDGAIM